MKGSKRERVKDILVDAGWLAAWLYNHCESSEGEKDNS
jgi:hypothetical protein